VWTY
jgi:hypothetical protein